MTLARYRMIEDWTEADLHDLTSGETDEYEFKSSRIGINDMMKEIQVAASAFWNSGGGVLIIGLDDKGRIDGGIDERVGRQRLRDWVDRVISHVEPKGPYFVKTIASEGEPSNIEADKVVLVIAYGESNNAPHMAPDKRYYVRAGAHSDPAGHFLVEAIRARRRVQQPVLRGLLRANSHSPNLIDLVILSLNDTAALDVRVDFDGLSPDLRENLNDYLPLYIPVIDRLHPFTMDASWLDMPHTGKPIRVVLRLAYQDLAGRTYAETQPLDPTRSIAPLNAAQAQGVINTQKTLKDLSKQIKRLRRAIERSDTTGALLLQSDADEDEML